MFHFAKSKKIKLGQHSITKTFWQWTNFCVFAPSLSVCLSLSLCFSFICANNFLLRLRAIPMLNTHTTWEIKTHKSAFHIIFWYGCVWVCLYARSPSSIRMWFVTVHSFQTISFDSIGKSFAKKKIKRKLRISTLNEKPIFD